MSALSGDELLDLLGVDDVMQSTGWARYTVLEKLRAGELPSVRLGHRRPTYRVPRAALVAYLQERLTVPAPAPAPRPRPSADPVPGRRRPRRAAPVAPGGSSLATPAPRPGGTGGAG